MKKVKVPIFTEEYSVWVYIGSPKDVAREARKYVESIDSNWGKVNRGRTYNGLPYKKHPLIIVNGDLPYFEALATLAHEASHAMDYIVEFIGLDDRSGEFRGHGIGAIMRIVGKSFKK